MAVMNFWSMSWTASEGCSERSLEYSNLQMLQPIMSKTFQNMPSLSFLSSSSMTSFLKQSKTSSLRLLGARRLVTVPSSRSELKAARDGMGEDLRIQLPAMLICSPAMLSSGMKYSGTSSFLHGHSCPCTFWNSSRRVTRSYHLSKQGTFLRYLSVMTSRQAQYKSQAREMSASVIALPHKNGWIFSRVSICCRICLISWFSMWYLDLVTVLWLKITSQNCDSSWHSVDWQQPIHWSTTLRSQAVSPYSTLACCEMYRIMAQGSNSSDLSSIRSSISYVIAIEDSLLSRLPMSLWATSTVEQYSSSTRILSAGLDPTSQQKSI